LKVKGRSFTVVGAARSGLAAANHLATSGADVHLVDHKPGLKRPADLHAAVSFASGTNSVRSGDVAIISPGIPEVSPVRQEIASTASEVMGEMELFGRLCPSPIIGITGTDGKSTVTTMIGAIMEQAGKQTFVGGNLGNPLTLDLEEMSASSVAVAEVSCFQLTSCSQLQPEVAVVTNIAVDHVDYHGSFEGYQAAKRRIALRMEPAHRLVLNGDDSHISAWELDTQAQILRFSAQGAVDADARYVDRKLMLGQELLLERHELPLLGIHNVSNALAAALAAQAFGIDVATIRKALSSYEALAHRLRTVATIEGIRWVNDSKATNPNASSAALNSMETPSILLAGGSDKDADFTELGTLIRDKTKAVVLFGQTKSVLARAIGDSHPVFLVETLHDAMDKARSLAVAGDTVLLSPACASYDQFNSYAHRGEVFEALVQQAVR
jgi:UDP-N-acetylmuramoylalanine--D-glutamate ligase